MAKPLNAILILNDGTVIYGKGFGSECAVSGELVFNTGMTGYQEALTDPSYQGQILLMTYPLIGNYGINRDDWESDRVQVKGFVVREICEQASHRAAHENVSEFLKTHDVPGISDLDTRMLTVKIRQHGTMLAILKTYSGEISKEEIDELIRKAKELTPPEKRNLVANVSCSTPEGVNLFIGNPRIVVIDCGAKKNIIRELEKRKCAVVSLPYNTTSEQIKQAMPDGILISNGPGDPAHPEIMKTVVETVKEIHTKYPIMGICLGHQIISLALGASTYKLKFGHRGVNQPVKDLRDNKVYITTQNHGFAVNANKCPEHIEIIGININDGTVEAIRHKKLPIFSVQYHPEASPGPWDNKYLFDSFIKICRKEKI
jgi:carbamoyl-phosphate synthase small subunit